MKAVSLVNQLTAEVFTLPELLHQLRMIERGITRLDDTICGLSASLKAAKQDRDKAVAELRSITREIKVHEGAQRRQGKVKAKPAPKES